MPADEFAQFFESKPAPPEKPHRSPKDDPAFDFRKEAMPHGKTPPGYAKKDFHALDVTTEHPKDDKELTDWYGSLSPQHQEMANQLQEALKAGGYKGWLDPKIKGKLLETRNYLFDLTAQHWQHKRPEYLKQQKEFRKKRTGSEGEEEFFGRPSTPQKSELKDFGPEIGMLGGRAMGGEEEEAEVG